MSEAGSAIAASGGRRSALWMVIQQISTLALTGLFAIVYARVSSVADFGAYSFVITVAALGVAVANGGLQALGIKLFHDRPGSAGELLNSIITVRESVAVLCFLGIVVIAATSGSESLMWATILGGTAVFVRALDAPELFYQSTLRARIPSLIRLACGVAFFGMRILALTLTTEVLVYVALYLAEYVVTSAALLIAAARTADWRPWRSISRRETFSLGRSSFPLYLSSIANQINLKIDIVIIQILIGSTAVGLYSAASRISELLYVIPVAYMTATFPVLLKVRAAGGQSAYRKNLQRAYDAAFWLGVLFVVATFLLSGFAIDLLFGSDYAAAADVLRIHALACPFIFMAAVLSKWIIAEGSLWISIARHSAGAVAAVALNFLLIPSMGIIGSAWATVVSYSLASFFFAFLSARTLPAGLMMLRAIAAPVRYLLPLFRRLKGSLNGTSF